MNEFKNPYVEDYEYCKKGTHTFVLYDDGTMKCHNCDMDFKDFRKMEESKKEK